MSEMVERVAKALFAGMYPGHTWSDQAPSLHHTMRLHARAAIEALREPTAEMVKAWEPYAYSEGRYVGMKIDVVVREVWWPAMIDAALA